MAFAVFLHADTQTAFCQVVKTVGQVILIINLRTEAESTVTGLEKIKFMLQVKTTVTRVYNTERSFQKGGGATSFLGLLEMGKIQGDQCPAVSGNGIEITVSRTGDEKDRGQHEQASDDIFDIFHILLAKLAIITASRPAVSVRSREVPRVTLS